VNILIWHRDALFVDAVRGFLEDRGFRLTVANDLREALELSTGADTCVVDMRLSGALDMVRGITGGPNPARVVVFVESTETREARWALDAGAAALVSGRDGLDRFVRSLDGDHAPGVLRGRDGRRNRYKLDNRLLTPREESVLAALIRGESTKAMAARMNVSPATARTHVQNVLSKLGVHTRLQAVAVANERVDFSSTLDLSSTLDSTVHQTLDSDHAAVLNPERDEALDSEQSEALDSEQDEAQSA
jgi:DNA-binding NarL/FixJ family response regulator